MPNRSRANADVAPDLFPDSAPTPAPAVPARPTLYAIPITARAATCQGETCGAPVYWVPGIPYPLSVNPAAHPECRLPTMDRTGQGVNHFADCPDRDQFRRRDGRRGTR